MNQPIFFLHPGVNITRLLGPGYAWKQRKTRPPAVWDGPLFKAGRPPGASLSSQDPVFFFFDWTRAVLFVFGVMLWMDEVLYYPRNLGMMLPQGKYRPNTGLPWFPTGFRIHPQWWKYTLPDLAHLFDFFVSKSFLSATQEACFLRVHSLQPKATERRVFAWRWPGSRIDVEAVPENGAPGDRFVRRRW